MNKEFNSYKFIYTILLASLVLIIISSCNNKKSYTPKPRGYFRIEFPQKGYMVYDNNQHFKFEYPKYSEIKILINENDSSWININYPEFNGTIHLSYFAVKDNLPLMLEDSRKLAYKHTIKADAISEQRFENYEDHVYGILYDIEGNAASAVQFFLTDSSSHFLRGALYFNVEPNKDSLAPVLNFVRKDIINLIETFEWK